MTVALTYLFSDTVDVCQGVYNWHGVNLINTGLYIDTLQTIYGCDSVFHLQLNINPVDTVIYRNFDSLVSMASNASYQWLNCDNQQSILGATNNYYIPISNGNFSVIVNQNNCTDTSNCFTVNDVGIKGLFENNRILLYPNPNNGYFTIEVKASINTDAYLKIYNSIGHCITSKEIHISQNSQNHIDLNSMANGVYYLQLSTEEGVVYREMVMIQ